MLQRISSQKKDSERKIHFRTFQTPINNFELFQTFSKFNPGNKVKCCKVSVVKGEKSTFSWFPNTENVLFSGLVINSYDCSKTFSKFDAGNEVKCCKVSVVKG